MKAVTLGNSGVLIREIDPPKPQPHQIMVKVNACLLYTSAAADE